MSIEQVAPAIVSVLPLTAIVIPAAAAVLIVAIGGRNERLRNMTAILAAVLTFGVVLLIGISVLGGATLVLDLGIIDMAGAFSLTLAVDPMGALFTMIAALLWMVAVAHSHAYMKHEQNRTRFFATLMVAEAAILGVFMAGDFLSLFVFFEIMGLVAYLLVVHSGTDEAKKAATKYMYMAIAGGLSLLMGILLYLNHSGTLSFSPYADDILLTGPLQVASLACMIAGFGVKAGIVPLHVWLPDAHPVAPSPASALLSGIMIKAGAYGIIRTVTSFFYIPPPNTQSLGLALIAVAIVTAFIGMILAVRQNDMKRTLAYSSISQMGFLLLGVGCLAFLGDEGAMGLGASLYHITSHAFFKSCLFMTAGSVLYSAHTTHMSSLGGLWRRMPVTTLIWCVAVLGLMGIPPFNGFVSKSMLHHAVVEAQYLAVAGTSHAVWLQAVEVLFTVIAAGTIVYGLKMTYYVFFRRAPTSAAHDVDGVQEAPIWMMGAAGLLAIGVLLLGLAPGFVLNHIIGPVTQTFSGLDPHSVAHLYDLEIYTWYNIKDVFLPLALGIGVFLVVTLKTYIKKSRRNQDPFHYPLPRWLSVDRLYSRGACAFIHACYQTEAVFNRCRERYTLGLERSAQTYFTSNGILITTGHELLVAVKNQAVSAYRILVEKPLPRIREYGDDIALGALIISMSLVFFLILAVI